MLITEFVINKFDGVNSGLLLWRKEVGDVFCIKEKCVCLCDFHRTDIFHVIMKTWMYMRGKS